MKRLALVMIALLFFPALVLAQVLSPDSNPVDVMGQAFTALGQKQLWLGIPLVVWLIVWVLRNKVGTYVPALTTKLAGLILAFLTALAVGFADTAFTMPTWSGPLVVATVFKVVYGFIGSMGWHSGQKTVGEVIAPAPA